MYFQHPNIVKLYGFFDDEENIYLLLEYCSGGHLLRQIKSKPHFNENEVLDILANIFEAVSFLHCHGVIHRDLKPENIVIQHVFVFVFREHINSATLAGRLTLTIKD